MKSGMKIFVIVFLGIFFCSCTKESAIEREINQAQMQERHGIYYAVNESKPYTGKLIRVYNNGQKESEFHIKDGKLSGLTMDWYPNGQKKAEQYYKGGLKEGKWTEWYESGQKKGEEYYRNGVAYGKWTEWYENGKMKGEEFYKDGVREGTWTEWYENGQKRYESLFENGIRNSIGYYGNGQLRSKDQLKWKSVKGLPDWYQDGPSTYWYENGQKIWEGYYKDGMKEGKWTYWYKNGDIKSEESYKSGIQ